MTTRVFLVDDHTAFRQPLAFMLGREPDITVVAQAGSVAEARLLLRDVPADIAVVDLDLGDGNGMDLIPEIRAINPDGHVLVLTASANNEDLARAVSEGASGILHKSTGVDEIIDAVRRLSQGESIVDPAEMMRLLRYATRQHTEQNQSRAIADALTPREREILNALAEGLSDKEIAEKLSVSTQTARTHMVNILAKLGVNSRLQALVFAVRHGLVEIR
jgi:DNA-binding NarL/FixJ family response regulator